ncbi:MAG: BON domain-containing protein [Chromatiales bacterium]|nr:BON domain-containing protein [Gammaproteobacteria bacterium]MBW6476241.1 BON domain-containing protein [Chromatiales bacterium]
MRALFLLLFALLTTLPLVGCAPLLVGGAAASGIIVAQDRRTAGTMLNDQRIEMRVKDYIVKDKELLDNSHVKVDSYNGIVLLTGEVALPVMAERIHTFTKQEAHVREVRNELRIAPPSEMAARRADIALNSRVRSALFSDRDVKSGAIRVVTHDGTVYLLGLVTRAEAEQVVEATRAVSGVKHIVRIFEYIRVD